MTGTHSGSPASPGVHFPPPLLFVAGFLAGWLLERTYPLPIFGATASAVRPIAGWLGVVVWAILFAWAATTFRRHRTTMLPYRPASAVAVDGPYRFSRNPMYLGLVALYAGVAFLVDTAWPLLLLPLVLYALYALVIRREERYLLAAFGEEYARYRRAVSRWL